MTAITSFRRQRAGARIACLGFAFASFEVACVSEGVFECEDSGQCGPDGVCEPVGFCSFSDRSCESGRRYGARAAGDVAGECVLVPPPSFDPSNFSSPLWKSGSAAIEIKRADASKDGLVAIDTDEGTIQRAEDQVDLLPDGVTFQAVAQGPGLPELAVFSSTGLTIGVNVTLEVVGSRALVFAVAGNVEVGGSIDVSGASRVAGPGGFDGATAEMHNGLGPGAGMSASPQNGDVGGGGGGHFAPGGQGGTRAGNAGGQGGGTAGNAPLIPLVGGSGGGAGGGGAGSGIGGGGGGALQISATGSLTVANQAEINAGGAGGGGGSNDDGGGGGGAGGAVLLEALSMTIAGTIAVNGGGGGAGANETIPGAPGAPGAAHDRRARGGPRAGEGAAGGNGGAGAEPAGEQGGNTAGVADDDNAGGGGGAGGRIRLRATTIDHGAGVLSPVAGLSESGL